MYVSSEVAEIINKAFSLARSAHFEYVTPARTGCSLRRFGVAGEASGGLTGI